MHTNYYTINKQFLATMLLFFLPLTAIYAAVVDFNSMVATLATNSGPIIRFIAATSYVIGLWFIISAIQALKVVGTMQSSMTAQTHGSVGGPLVKFIIGILLMYLPSTIDVTVWTLWGHSAFGSAAGGLMSYTPNSLDPFAPAKQGAIAIVRVIGYISFVRGLIILSHANNQAAQPGSFSKGIAHIIGGILAINIVETIRVIGNSFGVTIF